MAGVVAEFIHSSDPPDRIHVAAGIAVVSKTTAVTESFARFMLACSINERSPGSHFCRLSVRYRLSPTGGLYG
jgi:hypothetical protein